MRILEFKSWLYTEEAAPDALETKEGSELLSNPLMKAAMYLAYRASYDQVAREDHEEAIKTSISQGRSEEEAKATNKFQPPWSQGQWTGEGGLTRAPHWTFLGRFPSQADLQLIQEKLAESGGDIQALADSNTINLANVGGVAYRSRPGTVKLTGLWGWNSRAKMMAVVNLAHQTNQAGHTIFTGADSKLMDMINRSKPLIAKMHQKDPVKTPSPEIGLSSPPPDVIPLIYSAITNHPSASGGGSWEGYNDDGSLNFNLSGIGMRKKFPLGNTAMWTQQIKNVLNKAGISDDKIQQIKPAIATGGMMASMAASMINQKLTAKMPEAKPLSLAGLQWIFSHV